MHTHTFNRWLIDGLEAVEGPNLKLAESTIVLRGAGKCLSRAASHRPG
jgi:hypothetical protein